MVKSWSDDDPKAALMTRKRALLVEAATHAFLEHGFAETSVNRIAADAGVSIKTLYRHFDNKDDLFSAVMQAACSTAPDASIAGSDYPSWYDLPPAEAFVEAGTGYLKHLTSSEQLALYRVVVRDAARFPELGRRYLDEATGARDARFTGYLDRWAALAGWTIRDGRSAARSFAVLLKADLFDEVLLGIVEPTDELVVVNARRAAERMLSLVEKGCF